MDGGWERRSDEEEQHLPRVGPYPAAGLVRRARRIRDVSQRELAKLAGVSPSTVGRIESGDIVPSLSVLQRLLAVVDLHLVVVDAAGAVIKPMRSSDDTRDGAGRQYPSHLDVILDPLPGEWWADAYGLARPPETFYRNRRVRDAMRRRSQWEVRVKQLRFAPEPPDVSRSRERRERQRQLRELYEDPEYRDRGLPAAEVDSDDID